MLSLALLLATQPLNAALNAALNVMAYNVLLSGGRPRETVAVIAGAEADVVLLQEVTPAWRNRLESSTLRTKYPHRRYLPRRGAYGFAILSRFPLTQATTLQVPGAEPSSFCALATLPTSQKVALCSLHLKSARSAFYEHKDRMFSKLEENSRLRVHQWEKVLAWLDENAADLPHVLGGDTNTPAFDGVLGTLTARHKDAAAASAVFPDSTYPAIPKDALLQMRLDYIFVSPFVKVIDFDVVKAGGSDHFAVLTSLELSAANRSRLHHFSTYQSVLDYKTPTSRKKASMAAMAGAKPLPSP